MAAAFSVYSRSLFGGCGGEGGWSGMAGGEVDELDNLHSCHHLLPQLSVREKGL